MIDFLEDWFLKSRESESILYNQVRDEIEEFKELATRAAAHAEITTRILIKTILPPIPNIYDDNSERRTGRYLRAFSPFLDVLQPGMGTEAVRRREEDRRRIYNDNLKVRKTALFIVDHIFFTELHRFYYDCKNFGVVEAVNKWENRIPAIKAPARIINTSEESKKS